MSCRIDENYKLTGYTQTSDSITRYINPNGLTLSPEYSIEVFALGLDTPIGMVFSENGDLYIALSGIISGSPKVVRLRNGHFEIIAENFISPMTGINYMDENIYVSHKGCITVLNSNGTRRDIISGLPCNGDHGISNIAFGPDGKIYFGLGTLTNSGVVGVDNQWIFDHPLMHDILPVDVMLNGQNFETGNIFNSSQEKAYTGAFSPYGVPNSLYETKKGVAKASGSILKANRDGTGLELVAWGFRSPVYLNFDREFRLFVSNCSYDVRGSRPIANAPDEFLQITPGVWYGWPDYSAGEPITLSKFRPEGGLQPEFLLMGHPSIPPKPFAAFPPHSTITGFDFNYNENFGPYGDVYIAEFGSLGSLSMGQSAPYVGIGHQISKIDMNTGEISTFIMNKSGLPAYIDQSGGFGRLVDVTFGPDGAMYLLDMGISDRNIPYQYIPNTGVIWRVTKSS